MCVTSLTKYSHLYEIDSIIIIFMQEETNSEQTERSLRLHGQK